MTDSSRVLLFGANPGRGLRPQSQCQRRVLCAGPGGRPLVRAPEIVARAGFDYETSISDGLKLSLKANAGHTSRFYANPSDQPARLQRGCRLLDAGVSIAAEDDAWKLDLIGRNLTNEYYITRANDVTFTGSGMGTPNSIHADVSAVPSRGREIMLRATISLDGLGGR